MDLFEKAFRGKRSALLKRLDVSLSLLSLLRDEELLTPSQCESLKLHKANHEKVDHLLTILGRLEDSKFDVFCSVLKTDGQSAVVEIIRPEDESTHLRPDTSHQAQTIHNDEMKLARFKDSLTKNQLGLIAAIDPSHGLLVALNERGVLNDRAFSSCRAKETDEDQVEELIKRLKRVVNYEKVLLFYEALKASEQEDIVNKFFSDGGKK